MRDKCITTSAVKGIVGGHFPFFVDHFTVDGGPILRCRRRPLQTRKSRACPRTNVNTMFCVESKHVWTEFLGANLKLRSDHHGNSWDQVFQALNTVASAVNHHVSHEAGATGRREVRLRSIRIRSSMLEKTARTPVLCPPLFEPFGTHNRWHFL